MKKSILMLALVSMMYSKSTAQLTMQVSPGLNINGATVGYKFADRFVPFVGCRYLRAGVSYVWSGTEFSTFIPGQIDEVEFTDEAKVNFMLPTIGLKTFIMSRNKIKAYGTISASKPILIGKWEEDGTVNADIKEDLKNLKLFAAEVGFGMEYFFDDNFSIGGEFGMRYFKVHFTEEHDGTIFDPFSGIAMPATHEHIYDFSLSPTYSKIALNFYL